MKTLLKIFWLLLVLAGSAHASFPATSSGGGYTCTISSVQYGPLGTPEAACLLGAQSLPAWVSTFNNHVVNNCSSGHCDLYMSYINGGGGVGPITIYYTGSAGAFSCPSNATLSGESCTCNSGFAQSGSVCVADTPTTIYVDLEIPIGWVDSGGSNTLFTGPYTVLTVNSEPSSVCWNSFTHTRTIGTGGDYVVDLESQTNGHYQLLFADTFVKTTSGCGSNTSGPAAPAASGGGDTGGGGDPNCAILPYGCPAPTCPDVGPHGVYCDCYDSSNGTQTCTARGYGGCVAQDETLHAVTSTDCEIGSNAACVYRLDYYDACGVLTISEVDQRLHGTGTTPSAWVDSECDSAPTCTGDAVQCAIAKQSWTAACEAKKANEPDQETQDAAAQASALIGDSESAIGLKASATVVQISSFDQTGRGWSRSCPTDPVIELPWAGNRSFTIPFSKLCSPLDLLSQAGVGLTLLSCLMWVVGNRKA